MSLAHVENYVTAFLLVHDNTKTYLIIFIMIAKISSIIEEYMKRFINPFIYHVLSKKKDCIVNIVNAI